MDCKCMECGAPADVVWRARGEEFTLCLRHTPECAREVMAAWPTVLECRLHEGELIVIQK